MDENGCTPRPIVSKYQNNGHNKNSLTLSVGKTESHTLKAIHAYNNANTDDSSKKIYYYYIKRMSIWEIDKCMVEKKNNSYLPMRKELFHYPLASVDVEKFIDATVVPLEVIYILWLPLGFTP